MNHVPHTVVLRIALLDTHELVRYALRMRIEEEPTWQVSGVYRRAEELLDALEKGALFDLVVMNHVLDVGTDGLDLVRSLYERYPATRILVCSEYERAATIAQLFALGVNGFIGRTQSLDDHVEAVRKVAAGNTYFSARVIGERPPDIARLAPPSHPFSSVSTAVAHPGLTRRERTVLEFFLSGLSLAQIASRVNRSYKTVSSQKQSAYRKLGVRNDAELIARLSSNDHASSPKHGE